MKLWLVTYVIEISKQKQDTEYIYRVHEEEADKDSIFKCDLCDREFNSKMGLGVHKSTVHTIKTHHMNNKKRKSQCNDLVLNKYNKCGLDASSKDDLTTHMEVLHPIRSPPNKKERNEVSTTCNEEENTALNKTRLSIIFKFDSTWNDSF